MDMMDVEDEFSALDPTRSPSRVSDVGSVAGSVAASVMSAATSASTIVPTRPPVRVRDPLGHLVRLEVLNFKSYKGKQVIGPFDRFSCIIGPNGAGKSNVVDAISFVMGVRASQMRGSALRDLVYRAEGDEGVAREAFVEMVFEKPDETELHFKRTISPSGSSTYSINGSTVSWEQYDAALADVHLIVKAQNFMVLQGDVEAIATKTPLQLMQYFETIAGSAALQEEYAEALVAKEHAEENAIFNHNRQKGINAEKRQYKEQKAEADEFKRLQREQEAQQAEYLLWELFHVDKDLESVNAEKTHAEEELHLKQKQHDKVSAELKVMKAAQAKLYKESLKMTKTLKEATEKLHEANPSSIKVREKISFLEHKISTQRRRRERSAALVDEQRKLIETLKRDLAEVERAQQALNNTEAMDVAAEDVSSQLAADQLAQYTIRKEEAARLVAGERAALDTLVRTQELDQRERERKSERHQELKEMRGPIEALLSQLRDREDKTATLIRETEEQLREVVIASEEHERVMQQDRTKKDQLETELQVVQEKLAGAKADRKDDLREEKFLETISHLNRMFPGVRGRIGDLLKCTQRQYDTAVSVALGSNVNAIVTDDEKTAVECIQYLREQRLGRATFLPLDTIRAKPVDESLRLLDDSVKLVFDLVDYDKSLRKVAQYVCGNTLVCEAMQDALDIAFGERRRKVVTKQGALISKAGIITAGGSKFLSGRTKQVQAAAVDKLRAKRDELREQLVEVNRRLRNVGNQHHRNTQMESLKNRLKYANMDLTLTRRKIESGVNELDRIETRVTTLEQEMSERTQLERRIEAQRGEIEALERRVFEAEDEVFADFCAETGFANVREYEEKRLKVMKSRAERVLELNTLHSKLINQLEYEQSRDLETPLAHIESDIENDSIALEAARAEEGKIKSKLQRINQEIAKMERGLSDKKEEFGEKEVRVIEFKKRMQSLSNEVGELQKEIAFHAGQIEQLYARRHSLLLQSKLDNVSIPLLKGSLDDIAEPSQGIEEEDAMDVEDSQVMQLRYGEEDKLEVDFSSIPRSLRNMSEAQKKAQHRAFLEELNKRQIELDKMDPNLKAGAHFKSVQARFKTTAEALSAARQEARSADARFKSVSDRRTSLFMDAFTNISETIDEVYKQLTATDELPGGTAYLSLDNQVEPYLGGIKFTAMPPSKRFRDMEQLSGGEKTVAALALLLSIQQYKPSPFCVLDEIDAALDKPNIEKVTRYLKLKSPELQFIVISLNNRFFEQCDSLVGVMVDLEEQCSRSLTMDISRYPQ